MSLTPEQDAEYRRLYHVWKDAGDAVRRIAVEPTLDSRWEPATNAEDDARDAFRAYRKSIGLG